MVGTTNASGGTDVYRAGGLGLRGGLSGLGGGGSASDPYKLYLPMERQRALEHDTFLRGLQGGDQLSALEATASSLSDHAGQILGEETYQQVLESAAQEAQQLGLQIGSDEYTQHLQNRLVSALMEYIAADPSRAAQLGPLSELADVYGQLFTE